MSKAALGSLDFKAIIGISAWEQILSWENEHSCDWAWLISSVQ